MQDLVKKYNEANERYCLKCRRRIHCHTPCPLVNAYMLDLSCTSELERIAGFKEVTTNGKPDEDRDS